MALLKLGFVRVDLGFVPDISEVTQELKQGCGGDQDQRPCPGGHVRGEGRDVHPADDRVEEVIGGDGATGANHDHGGQFLLDAL